MEGEIEEEYEYGEDNKMNKFLTTYDANSHQTLLVYLPTHSSKFLSLSSSLDPSTHPPPYDPHPSLPPFFLT